MVERGFSSIRRTRSEVREFHPGTIVKACEVYLVGHTNAPKGSYYGKWLNYFYFDRDEKLIGFDRLVID